MASSNSIIIRHGPYGFYETNAAGMPEGGLYEAGISGGDGSLIEVLYVGSHDGTDRILGGGFQIYDGDLSSLTAPRGVSVLDSDNQLRISDGSSWQTISIGPAGGVDYGSLW